jgi:epoxyqueuosine reductase
MAFKEELKSQAERLGFSLFGVAAATNADTFPQFITWLDAGHHSEMDYLMRMRDARQHPRSILESVRSVVMLGFEYAHGHAQPASNHGRVAAYAQGPDYHRVIWDRLAGLTQWLQAREPTALARGVTDTAPLLERDFARRAGLGWFGKNTMLINKHRGSFFLLAALLTSVELPHDPPHTTRHCGTCTACLDACPTQAFVVPGVLDARRCISYHTIESRSRIPLELAEQFGDWMFGCDVCQDVCPWNRHADSRTPALPHDDSLEYLDAVAIVAMSVDEFRTRFRTTAITRTKHRGLRRNAAIVLGNVGDERALNVLERAQHDDDAIVAEAARWAITRIRTRYRTSVRGDS